MPNIDKTFTAESGAILSLFPDQKYGVSFSNWSGLHAEATEQSSPNLGRYDVTLDDQYNYWMVFEGVSQPTDWNQWIDIISIVEPARDWTTEEKDKLVELFRLDEDPYIPPNIIIPPPVNPEYSSGYLLALDKNMDVQSGVVFFIVLEEGPGTSGYSYDRVRRQSVSDIDGIVTFTNLIRGAKYRIWKGKEPSSGKSFIVPDEDVFELPEVL